MCMEEPEEEEAPQAGWGRRKKGKRLSNHAAVRARRTQVEARSREGQ